MGGIEAYFRLKFPAPRGLPPHLPEPAITLERLRRLLALLDRWLDSPVRVRRDARGHTAWVAGALGYRVDVASRSVYPVFHRDCGFASGDFRVNLLDYLRTPDWLECVMLKAGLAASGPQARLFSPSPESDHGDGWIRATAYRQLCRDPRFRALRHTGLRRAVGLDPTVLGIALAMRPLPWFEGLDSRDYTWA